MFSMHRTVCTQHVGYLLEEVLHNSLLRDHRPHWKAILELLLNLSHLLLFSVRGELIRTCTRRHRHMQLA